MTALGGINVDAQTSLSLHAPPPPPHLPCVLVEEILCRLPVKHLLRFCCVCKSWNYLISRDSKFAKKHLRFSTISHDRHHLVLRSGLGFRIWNSPISSIFTSETSSIDSFTQLDHPLIKQANGHDTVSTCDGILCFNIDESLALLCNPSIRKFKKLPPLDNLGIRYYQTLYTFVYDRFIDNYKIIALSSCGGGKKEVNVHTLGTDCWRNIQDFPDHYRGHHGQGVFVTDTVNWLAYDPSSSSGVIVSLDLKKEQYQQFLQPLYDESASKNLLSLGALRDCLCIFSNGCQFSDIWIMKEYGKEESWTKLRVPYIGDPYFHVGTKPLYIYEDDRVLMMFIKRRKICFDVYDSRNNIWIREIQNNIPTLAVPTVYVESLISHFL